MYQIQTVRLAAVAVVAALAMSACVDGAGADPANTPDTPDAAEVGPEGDADAPDAGFTCKGDAPDSTPVVVTTEINGWWVSVDSGGGAWSIRRSEDEEPVLSGPGTCDDGTSEADTSPIRLGSGEAAVKNSFGNFDIDLFSERASLEWLSAADASPEVDQSDGQLVVRWPLEGDRGPDSAAELRFAPDGEENLSVSLSSTDDALTSGELSMDCQPDEAFFGLGSQATGMDLRGRTYPLWTQEQGNGKPEDGGIFPLNNTSEAAYAPMGIWHSSAGYSAVIGHDSYSEIDLCETREGRAQLRSHRALPEFVLVDGDGPKDRLEQITEYTGRLDPRPPAWVFGTWVDAVDGPWRLDEVAQRVRAADIPVSAIWTEDWIGGESTTTGFRLSYKWEWDEPTYPELPDQIDGLQADGFAFLGYFNPFIPRTVPGWQEATEAGYLIKNADGEDYTFQDPAFRTASLVDLTNPDTLSWLREYQLTAAEELGLDGWMADFAEWLPHDAQLHSGEVGWEVHNRYPLLWQEANRAALVEAHEDQSPDNDWTFFARSGWASTNGGSAGLAATMWGGDQNTDWKYDDGFPTVVPIGAHLGMSGVAVFGSDIAGYNSLGTSNTDKELFFRWSAAAAFHPLMRTHHGGDRCDNWHFGRDAETLAHFRRWASVHTLLFPYFDRLVDDATERGLPITRHPYLVEPDSPALWDGDNYQFFVGDHLLVAPVLEEDASSRPVTLPDRGWWPLFGDEPLGQTGSGDDGAVTIDPEASVTEVPAFVRPGTALPLLSEVVDSLYGSSNATTTDLDDVADSLRVALYPDADGHVELAERDGLSVFGTAWMDGGIDWSQATVDDVVLPACGDVDAQTSCVDADAGTARLVDVEETTLRVGPARLEVAADTPTDFEVGVGGDAFGELAEPTEYTGLNADAPSWCEGAPDAEQ
ncbi:MAG: TIM-barrel domain-containing protein [Persicimonas sp.]